MKIIKNYEHCVRTNIVTLHRQTNNEYFNMTNKELNNGTFIANWAQLVSDNASFIVPASNYNVRNDERLLIPFMQNQKIGFVNQEAVPIVEPKYDIINGNIYCDSDFIEVGIRYSYGVSCGNAEPRISIKYKIGLLDYMGKVVFEPIYTSIAISDNRQLFTLRENNKGYCVMNIKGEVIVPYGRFCLIDGFTNGYARVKIENKWGIIDTKGNIALPVVNDNVWCFYNKPDLKSTKVIKDGQETRFSFVTCRNKFPFSLSNDDYRNNYGEYAGTYAQDVAGYSDDIINDAFDGEPEAYWNID